MFPNSLSSGIVSPTARLSTLPAWPWEDPLDRHAQRTLGFAAASWAQRNLIQPNGPWAGRRFKLSPDQLRFLLWWYAVDDEGGWLFNHGVRRLAKGSGKSPFAAVLALTEFLGPVRLERFDDRALGGCRGRAVDMPLVQIAATAESQTANTMRMVRAFAQKGSKLCADYALDPGKTKYYRLPEGTLEVITSSATAAEGAESSFVVADETEHWKPNNGGPELAATLEDNLAKSGSRMLETSNAWIPGEESVAEDSWDAWVAQEEGRYQGEQRILYDARIAPPDTDMGDPDSLRSALEHVYGDCEWKRPAPDLPIDVKPIMERIFSPRSRRDDSERKYLNWPSAALNAWVTPELWLRMADPSIELHERDRIAMFFDGSKSRDATALIGCRISDGHVFTLGIWEPSPSHDANDTVDAAEVDRAVELAFQRFRIEAFFADVKEWESFTLLEWPKRYGAKLAVHSQPGTRPPQSIAWDMRSHKDEFARAAEACEAEIFEGSFTHDGHPALARHVANCRRRPYREMITVGKETADSPKKIDAAVAMIGARMVRRIVAGKLGKRRSGVVW